MSMDIKSLRLQKFEDYGSKLSRKIGITASMQFTFLPYFCSENGLDKFERVETYYDPAQKVIGFRFLPGGDEGGYRLCRYGRGGRSGAAVSAKAFFTKFGIDAKSAAGKYLPVKHGDLFLVQLKPSKAGNL